MSPQSQSLDEAIRKREGERNVFGKTRVRVRVGSQQTEGFYNPRIKRQVTAVFRNEKGQFQSRNEFMRKPIRVTVDPFPNLTNTKSPISQLGLDRKQSIKLYGNETTRDIVGPFTQWFFENRLRRMIEREVNNAK